MYHWKEVKKVPEKMTRTFNISELKTREATDGKSITVGGYAAMFNSRTTLWEGFDEIILTGAFSKTLSENGDVRCLFNHDWSKVLGRTKSGTLRLFEDDRGLKFEVDLPNNSYANDLVESMERGDINQCSFGFIISREELDWDSDPILRTILEVELYEVSVVSIPAYDDTEASVMRGKQLKNDFERRLKILNKIKGVLPNG
ncbi:HK97 family phage prohead protease [Carnobacterium maltaromaticum]|uniref:HK97 family phage prohead protease n=1 Tax=Carnobacterium maltaromaticum TaxID=2751 RepID=UPI0039B12587